MRINWTGSVRSSWAGGLVAVCLALAVAACGSSSGGGSGSGSGGSGSSGAKTIKVGWIGPLTGPLAAAGLGGLHGAQAAVRYLNNGGGVSGYKYDLVTVDDQGNPTNSAADARQMVGEGVKMLLIGSTEGSDGAIQPIANQSKVLNISPNNVDIASGMSATGKYPYAFGTGPGFTQYAEKQAQYAADVLHVKEIGEIYSADPVGEFFASSMTAAAKQYGLKVVSQSFPDTQSDVSAQLNRLKSAGVQALCVWTYGTPLVNVAESLAKVGWTPTVLTVQGSADPAVVSVLKKQAPAVLTHMYGGAISTNLIVGKSGALPTDPLAKAFVEGLKAVQGGGPLNGNAPTAVYLFDSMIAYDRGIKGAGSTNPDLIAKYLSTTPVQIAQGTTDWSEKDRSIGVSSSGLGLFRSNSDFSNGTAVAAPR